MFQLRAWSWACILRLKYRWFSFETITYCFRRATSLSDLVDMKCKFNWSKTCILGMNCKMTWLTFDWCPWRFGSAVPNFPLGYPSRSSQMKESQECKIEQNSAKWIRQERYPISNFRYKSTLVRPQLEWMLPYKVIALATMPSNSRKSSNELFSTIVQMNVSAFSVSLWVTWLQRVSIYIQPNIPLFIYLFLVWSYANCKQ